MTDIKRYSLEDSAPQPPAHDNNQTPPILDISPTPSKSIHRSKTVRNLNSAGNKMKGLFKTKNKDTNNANKSKNPVTITDENGFMTRPILSSSVSYGPGTEHTNNTVYSQRRYEESNMSTEQSGTDTDTSIVNQQQQQQAPPPPPTSTTLQPPSLQTQVQQQTVPQQQQTPPNPSTDDSEQVLNQQKAQQQQQALQQQSQQQAQQQAQQQQLNFQHELESLNELIAQRTAEIQKEKKTKERLQSELMEAQRVFKEREAEYSTIEHSFFEHTRAIRATDDDLSTIRDSFKLLKYSIARLIMTLNKKADKARAAQKFTTTWPSLVIVDPTTGEMEPSLVNLLAEKLVHEHLVKHVFSAPIYPGLKVNDAYFALNTWLQAHSSQFSVRLRQQMAAVVAKSSKDSDIHLSAQKEKAKIATKIYEDLADIYHPFLRENDAAVEEDKRYYSKICDIVDKSLKLTIAIRGQEVEIKTVSIEEGNKQEFEEETMTEVKGRTGGLVRFCICPTFMGGDREHGFLEKGKVVVSS